MAPFAKSKKRQIVLVSLIGVGVIAILLRFEPGQPDAPPRSISGQPGGASSAGKNDLVVVLAAPGRIEGASEMIEVGAGIDGVLAAVLVKEGQRVKRGQVLALIDCQDIASQAEAARAEVESQRQARLRLSRGSREEERNEAAAETAAAKALLERAQAHYQRMARLADKGVIARETFDDARGDLEVAQAKLQAALERERLVNAPPRPEDLARADAEIEAAEQRLRTLLARLDKCKIRSPIEGTVLRCYLEAGETVSVLFPRPIVAIMDTSKLRVRTEVDERDLNRIGLGQPAVALVDAFPEEKFTGRVASIGYLMGRKKVRTGDPAEKSDRDVLEVLVDLDEADRRLVVGLRVTVRFFARRPQGREQHRLDDGY